MLHYRNAKTHNRIIDRHNKTQSQKHNSSNNGSVGNIDNSGGISNPSSNNGISLIKLNNQILEDYEMISEIFSKHFFMRNLTEENRKEVIKEMFLYQMKENSLVLTQGSIGVFFYIIKDGELEVSIDSKVIKVLKKGDSFGELALLHNSVRTSTVISKTDCLCWCLDRRKFRRVIDHINSKNFIETKKFIKSIPVLSNLPSDLISILCSNLLKVYYDAGAYIIREGDTAKCMYIIKEGEVEVKKNGNLVRVLRKNDYFGDHSILLNSNRTMDVISKSKSVIYCITLETLIRMLGDHYLDLLTVSLIKNCFTNSKYFSNFNLNLLDNILNYLEIKKYNRDNIVIKSSSFVNSKIFILLEGNLVDSKTRNLIATRGEIVFEEFLIAYSINKGSIKVVNDIVADPDCLICEADTETFLSSLGMENFADIFQRFNLMNLLMKVPYFSKLNNKALADLLKEGIHDKASSGSVIVRQGQVDPYVYVIKSGRVLAKKDMQSLSCMKFDSHFNDESLFSDNRVLYTVTALTDIEILKISNNKILSFLSEPLLKYHKESYLYRSVDPQLKDLNYIRDLGESTVGEVSLVKCKFSHLYYACKSILKARIAEDKMLDNLVREIELSKTLDHPFVTRVIRTIQSKYHIIMLKEFINGCELFVAMNEIGLFNKTISQFYLTSMLYAIDYLHSNNIIYRDLKPENIIISENVSNNLI